MMGLAGAKRNKARRLLTPMEIQWARFGLMKSNSRLIAWYDFSDKDLMVNIDDETGDDIVPTDNIKKVWNKAYTLAGQTGVGGTTNDFSANALGRFVFCDADANAPSFAVDATTGAGFLQFDGTNHHLYAQGGSTAMNERTNFSDATLDSNTFTMFIACRHTNTAARQSLLVIRDKNGYTTSDIQTIYLEFSNLNVLEAHHRRATLANDMDIGNADDEKFHYYMYNSWEQYDGALNTETCALEADGFAQSYTAPLSELDTTASHDMDMEFDGRSENIFLVLVAVPAPLVVKLALIFREV